jgi:hypothetical protein
MFKGGAARKLQYSFASIITYIPTLKSQPLGKGNQIHPPIEGGVSPRCGDTRSASRSNYYWDQISKISGGGYSKMFSRARNSLDG